MTARALSPSVRLLPLLAIACGIAAPAAGAEPKVQGELWRHTTSMQMEGMSMPSQTQEVCVPKGQATAAGGMDPSCRIYDAVSTGNTFRAKMECKGETPITGTLEQTTEGERQRGAITATMEGQTVTIRYDSTRLGKACEVPQVAPPKRAAPAVQGKDICTSYGEELAKDPSRIGEYSINFVRPGASCNTPAKIKPFCAALRTPTGFLDLSRGEAQVERMKAGGTLDEETVKGLGLPLQDAVRACGAGSGAEGVAKLRASLQPEAREKGAWDFLVLEGDETSQTFLRDTAKAKCAGRKFSSQIEPQYRDLCTTYGAALVRGDFAAAREIARSGSGDSDSGPAESAGAASTGGAAAPGGSAPGESPPPAKEDPANAAKDLLKKGRGVLRGILGGG
jgi:hypothetical protein